MRAVVQRVTRARVSVEGEVVGAIERGLVVLVGVARDDVPSDAEQLASKVVGLRIFPDDEGRMNRAVGDVGGALLAVSQFTLLGDARKGKRPSFVEAMEPDQARALFEHFSRACRTQGVSVETGRFREHMVVDLANDGPVTVLLDTKKTF